MKVVIVGGGIAGLCLAKALSQAGFQSVRILEKVPEFKPVGGGLTLTPRGTRVLEKCGLLDEARRLGLPFRQHRMLDERSELLGVIDHESVCVEHDLPMGVFLHRSALHQVLCSGVPKEWILQGVKVTAFSEAGVETQDHGSHQADLIVGADGIHSQVRQEVFGFQSHPLRFRSYRFVVDNEIGLEHFEQYLGSGGAVGLVPLGDGKLFVWISTSFVPEDPEPLQSGLESFKSCMSQYQAPAVIGALNALGSPDQVLATDNHEVTMESWFHNNAVLCGDAAHGMSPSQGAGAALALEDSYILAQELKPVLSGEQPLALALDGYYRRRMPRVESIRRHTRVNDHENHITDPEVCAHRNMLLKSWLRDTDAVSSQLAASMICEL